MSNEMVGKDIILNAIIRNCVLFNRKVDDKGISIMVDAYMNNLPFVTHDKFERVDKIVLQKSKFFPTLADYAEVISELSDSTINGKKIQ